MQLKTRCLRSVSESSSRSAVLLAAVLLMSACSGVPLPEEKREYAGLWRGENITLEIYPQGQVNYRKVLGAGHTRINGPIVAYEGNDFFTEVLFVKNRFRVDRPPFQEDGRWWIVVDGVKLKRLE